MSPKNNERGEGTVLQITSRLSNDVTLQRFLQEFPLASFLGTLLFKQVRMREQNREETLQCVSITLWIFFFGIVIKHSRTSCT
jgi:hypothetical protein